MNEGKKTKSPIFALILSAIYPGAGQLYLLQIPKGLILIGLYTIINLLLLEPLELIIEAKGSVPDSSVLIIVAGYTIAGLVLWIYSIIDAKKRADRINIEIDNLRT